ncbi:MAG: response regulator transcription factor [Lentisphaerales bacterium]|nr:response regulator transcription factor [Lentisphaerales bacterium]
MDDTINFWIIEDNEKYRKLLKRNLEREANLVCDDHFGECESAIYLLEAGGGEKPDILLLDLGLPGIGGLDAIKKIKAASTETHILILTVFDDRPKVIKALNAGASGYLLKRSPSKEIAKAMEDAIKGGSPLNPDVAKHLVASLNKQQPVVLNVELSTKELSILELIADGYAQKEVAEKLEIPKHTVDFNCRKICKKLEVNNITAAVSKAIKSGLLR